MLGSSDAGIVSWSSFATVSCLTTQTLISNSCITVEAEVQVTLGDAGFSYGSASAIQPPAVFVSAAESAFHACAPFFRSWDGGNYPYTY